MIEPWIFLALLTIMGIIANNKSLLIASSFLLFLKIIGVDSKLFSHIQMKGVNWGITVITIAVLAPISTGEIGFKDLLSAFKTPYAWIALISGIAVAVIAKGGVTLLAEDPHITVALVFGTIIAVTIFKGIPVGPLMGAGIAYFVMKAVEMWR